MDHSIHDVMNSLVAADAARMSGRDFADARGAGLARKVRTRRTVRAAGMGGASAVAVGGLAFGALHLPWGSAAVPGVGSSDCATASSSTSPYIVQTRYVDYLANQWTILDAASREIVFLITPEEVGKTWLVTYASGTTEVVPYSGPDQVLVEVPNGPGILLSVLTVDGAMEMVVKAYSVAPGGASTAAGGDCRSADVKSFAPSPSPLAMTKPAKEAWLDSGTESVLLYGSSENGGLVTLRRSQGYEQLRLDEYTVPVAEGIARVRVGDKVVRVKVDADGTLTVTAVEPPGSTTSLGEPTATAIDPWFFMGTPIDLDALVGW